MKSLFLLTLAALPLLALHQAAAPPCIAQITLSQQGDLLHVTGACRSQLAQVAHYHYELRTQRLGPGGSSRTTQGGHFELAAQQQVQLSQVSLGAGPDSHYRINLLVFDDSGRTVAQDSVSH
ncbi:MAG: hypothetical protein EOO63_07870 [Hymenobacter sp.]|nr:MAG: hypothetical protein EOO63_07870 [Hymenobacter sp.]